MGSSQEQAAFSEVKRPCMELREKRGLWGLDNNLREMGKLEEQIKATTNITPVATWGQWTQESNSWPVLQLHCSPTAQMAGK
jgi:hypothetical protein